MNKKTIKSLAMTFICATLLVPATQVYAEPLNKKPVVTVTNFDPAYGNKELNRLKMAAIIDEAHSSKGTDIIIFPELAVTGYAALDDTMPVRLAETKTGETAKFFSDIAEKYNMYIVYGAPEVVANDPAHAYDSAFVVTPDGYVDSYRKQVVSSDSKWCVPGSNPVTFETPFGKVGLSLGDDTFELITQDRMYSADGCFMLSSPSAIEAESYVGKYDYDGMISNVYSDPYSYYEWTDLNRNRTYNASYLSGLYIASANLIGKEGKNDELTFAGGANITGENNPNVGGKVWSMWKGDINKGADYTKYIMNVYAGGFDSEIEINSASIDPAYATHSLVDMDIYQPNLYTRWFGDLAEGKGKVSKQGIKSNPTVAVVNMSPEFGDCDANLKTMLDYMKQADESNVDILVFPEMALGDYAATSDPTSIEWKTVLDTEQTVDGAYAKVIEEKAKEYGMYIIYGTAEVNPGDATHPFNSAFVATPKGDTESYQKVQPVEGDWATKGTDPLIIDTPWGGLGVAICMDVYAYPEMAQYYSAAGCTMFANPTASGGYAGSNFIYNTALSSITARDGLAILSSDLVNDSGYENKSIYPGKSTIIDQNGVSPVYLSGESMVDETMYIATLDLSDNVSYSADALNIKMISECMKTLSESGPLYDGSGRMKIQ